MQPALTNEEREAFKDLVVKYHAAWSPGREAFDIRNVEQFYSQKPSLSAYNIMPTKGPIGCNACAIGFWYCCRYCIYI
jgi:hypothetical protein